MMLAHYANCCISRKTKHGGSLYAVIGLFWESFTSYKAVSKRRACFLFACLNQFNCASIPLSSERPGVTLVDCDNFS